MNAIENAKSYLADHGHSAWGREHTRKMVADLLAVAEENLSATQFKSLPQIDWEGISMQNNANKYGNDMSNAWNDAYSRGDSLNTRMADIREEGPGLVQRIKNWWAGR